MGPLSMGVYERERREGEGSEERKVKGEGSQQRGDGEGVTTDRVMRGGSGHNRQRGEGGGIRTDREVMGEGSQQTEG